MKHPLLQIALVIGFGSFPALVLAAAERPATAPSNAAPAATTDGTARPAADARASRDATSTVESRSADGSENRSVGTTIDDVAITAKVKTALFTDELTKARNINVDTMRSVVTLKGFVESQAEADRARRIAQSTEGVSSVKSELKVAN